VLVILAFLAAYASAAVRNITIDDESGDDISGIKPNYTDAKGVSWKQNAHANSCEKELDATKAHNGSWHGLTPRGNSQQRHGRRHGARGEGSDDDDEAKITLEFFGKIRRSMPSVTERRNPCTHLINIQERRFSSTSSFRET
jgi:hypothetical protein